MNLKIRGSDQTSPPSIQDQEKVSWTADSKGTFQGSQHILIQPPNQEKRLHKVLVSNISKPITGEKIFSEVKKVVQTALDRLTPSLKGLNLEFPKISERAKTPKTTHPKTLPLEKPPSKKISKDIKEAEKVITPSVKTVQVTKSKLATKNTEKNLIRKLEGRS